jgi:hypothetical protein
MSMVFVELQLILAFFSRGDDGPTSSSVHDHIPQQFAYGMPPMSTSHFSQQTQSLLPHTPILPPTNASTSAAELRTSTPATASVPSLRADSQMPSPYSDLYDMS